MLRDDGSILAFEICTPIVLAGIVRLLKSTNDVEQVSTKTIAEDRVYFEYKGEPAVITEPFGDNSRCWVGFEIPDASKTIDLEPLLRAFTLYRWYHYFQVRGDQQ